MFRRLLVIACLVGFYAVSVCAQIEERTIIDSERQVGRGNPWMMDYDGIGKQGGLSTTDPKYFLVRPDALKGIGLRTLQHISVYSWKTKALIPAEELLAFEREEVRQGRNSIFITATYEGKKRPVLTTGDLPGGLCEEHNTCGQNYSQAVNIGDDRYIKFWVKNLVRFRWSSHVLQNWYIGIDNSQYRYKGYMVLDDNEIPQKAQWDKPFPQNDDEFEDAAAYAFRRIKELAPDLILFDNQYPTPLSNMSRFSEVFEPVDGHSREAFLSGPFEPGEDPLGFWIHIQQTRPPDGPMAYKIQLPGDKGTTTSHEMQQKYLLYLIACGPNAFFCVRISKEDHDEPNLQWYAGIRNTLGLQVEPPQSMPEPGKEPEYRLYWRRCQGGIAYFNLTGVTKTIPLPDDELFYDTHGNPTTTLRLNHQEAGYVTFEPGERVARPRIDPRRPGLVTGPLTIMMQTEPFSFDTRIVYTLDGSEPVEGSTVYTGPFEISESCVVKARAFDAKSGQFLRLPSHINFATYRLTDQEPTVEFHLKGESGSEFLEHDYPVVSLSHVSAHPVTIRYSTVGGTATEREDYAPDYILDNLREQSWGTLTIRPGEQHRYFYVHIVNDEIIEPNETIMISISDPVNAILGENTIYTYTIEDNDRIDDIVEPDEVGESNIQEEGFERLFLSSANWDFSGITSWSITSEEQRSGIRSARAGSLNNHEISSISKTLNCISGDISFYCKVSSQQDCDFLTFYIDGIRQDRWSGERDWVHVSFPVEEGKRTFRWTYSKDESSSEGFDAAWIDDIVFPAHFQQLPTPPPSPQPFSSNLVAWWKFDEGMGTIAFDSSGHGNHGTFEGDPQWVAGYDGGGLEFDGIGDFVDCGNVDTPNAVTVMAWIKSTDIEEGGTIVSKVTDAASKDYNISVGSRRVQLWYESIGVDVKIESDRIIPTNEWTHIAIAFDTLSSGEMYINGVYKKSWNTTEDRNVTPRPVNIGRTPGRSFTSNYFDGSSYFEGIIDDVRIYNKALTKAEIRECMRGDPLAAWNPKPNNDSTLCITDVMPLGWSPGDKAFEHDVYFGTDRETVANADISDKTRTYRGRQGATNYNPPEGVEWGGGPYYWRIDEYNNDGTISKGRIWSFEVDDFIVIDDFEDYRDHEPDKIFETWIDGWEDPTNGSMSCHFEPPFAETTITHRDSCQSMPLYYDNTIAEYSEVTKTLVYPRDWTENGVSILSLWFYGDPSNANERMYVSLNGSAFVYHDNPNAALIAVEYEWTEWRIDLREFTPRSVNLTNVDTISIGFGNKNNPRPGGGGSGLVFFDDIRLYRPR